MELDFKAIRAGLHELIYVLSRVDPEDQPLRTPINRGKDCSRQIEAEIRKSLERISSLHQQKNKIDKLRAEAEQAFSDYKARKYEERRRVANIIISKESVRIGVFSRDAWKCVSCQTSENLTIDHVIPVKLGGGNELENLQTLCLSCNCSKGAKEPVTETTKRP
jgi:5-methylcytosine-specific restriction endonuclease McrA